MLKLKDLSNPGVVFGPASFAKWAEHNLAEAEKVEKEIRQLEVHKKLPLSDELHDQLQKLTDASLMHINSAILFAALEVEASLNFHGVVQLRDFFEENLEWLKPHQKLFAIVAITEQKLVEDKDEVVVAVKRLAKARNKIAHPKSLAFDGWEEVNAGKDESLQTARQAVQDMSTFMGVFKKLLPHSLHDDTRES
jgi:hypothetical protein